MRAKLGLTVTNPQYASVLTYLSKAERESYVTRKKAFNWALGIGLAFVVAALSIASSLAAPDFAFLSGYALGAAGVFVFLAHKKH